MNSTVNGTDGCISYFDRVRGEELVVFSISYFSVVYVMIITSAVLWFRQKDTFHLRERNGLIIMISLIGLGLNLITGPMTRSFGKVIPCVLDVMSYYLAMPILVWPVVVRLYLWVNKVKFNYKLAEKLAQGGVAQISTLHASLRWYRIRASTYYGLFWTIVPLVAYAVPFYYLADDSCR